MRISDWSSDVCSSDLIKVGAATPQLPIATNLIPAPVAAEASLTAQKMPGVDAAQIGATVLGEPDADISGAAPDITRSEEHTSELQSLMRISYAVFCLKKKKNKTTSDDQHTEYVCIQTLHTQKT